MISLSPARRVSLACVIAAILTAFCGPTAWAQRLSSQEKAEKLCSLCHLFPDPNILDRTTWETSTLPLMAKILGIKLSLTNQPGGENILKDWSDITQLYLQESPAVPFPQPDHEKIRTGLKQFKPEKTPFQTKLQSVTLVQADPDRKILFIGDAEAKRLEVLNFEGKWQSGLALSNSATGLAFQSNTAWISMIGSVTPSDSPLGVIATAQWTGNQLTNLQPALTGLRRPIGTLFADMDGDGDEDLVITTYGHTMGRFSWWENRGTNKYVEHVLIDRPGAIKAVITDLNKDGKPDVIVLMAQAKEGVFALINNGKDGFTEQPLLQFHPGWGSASFEWKDFNGDGFNDLLVANGDNGEYASCLRPYHGLRLYLNNGSNQFKEAWFFPLNGAYKTITSDFDGDGDLDIAAISFFPDYANTPEESFVYLENLGGMKYQPWTFEQSWRGRWITMDAADLDGDGDLDMVLGGYDRSPFKVREDIQQLWKTNGTSLMILRNQRKP